jgi:uncharacterized repeat protein (TIGR02543 family)
MIIDKKTIINVTTKIIAPIICAIIVLNMFLVIANAYTTYNVSIKSCSPSQITLKSKNIIESAYVNDINYKPILGYNTIIFYSDLDCTIGRNGFGFYIGSNVSYYVNPIDYTINFYLDGGSNNDLNPSTYTIESLTIDLMLPTKIGYTFNGWYSEVDFSGNLVSNISSGSIGDRSLYAKWVINQSTFSFNSNGGSTISEITQEYNTSVAGPSNPTRTGYSFDNWYTDEGLTKQYSITTMPAQNITLYAKWVINQSTFSFNSNGGSTVSEITQEYNTSVAGPSNPTRTGYSFDNWYTDEGLTKQYSITTMPAQNITLYAKWVKDATAPVVNGISNNQSYNTSRNIYFNEGTATLNNQSFTSGSIVSTEGIYTMVVTGASGKATTISFTIDKTAPIVTGVLSDNTNNSPISITFNEGIATLNGQAFASGTTVNATGDYTLIVTDVAGNRTTVNFKLSIPTPTSPTEATVSVNPPITITTKPISKPVVVAEQKPTYQENFNTLKDSLNGSQELPDEEFIQVLQDLIKVDSIFFDALDENEQNILESKVQEVFKDNFKISIEGSSVLKVSGLALISELKRLFNGDSVEIRVGAKDVIDVEDQELINRYISENSLDSSKLYSIDINLYQIIDGQEEQLTELKRPVMMTLPIPEGFEGITNFKIIQVHDGKVYELPVTINNDGTFTFSSDKFSSFTLVNSIKITPAIEEAESPDNSLYWLGGGLFLIAGAIIVYLNRKRLKN